jgi:hypothetical protein
MPVHLLNMGGVSQYFSVNGKRRIKTAYNHYSYKNSGYAQVSIKKFLLYFKLST